MKGQLGHLQIQKKWPHSPQPNPPYTKQSLLSLFISSSHSEVTKAISFVKQNASSNDNNRQTGSNRLRSELGAKWTVSGAA